MKYILTGSTGHITKPLAAKLIAAGHSVTIVTSSAAKTAEITAMGAQAAVGSLEDRAFVISTLAGADAAYLMIPPPSANVTDLFGFQKKIADNYIAATEANKVKHIVVLSSMGAHRGSGVGPIDGAAYFEKQLPLLTSSSVRVLRPSFFYYNLFAQIGMIKHAGFVGSTQAADFNMVMVHPTDIAEVAAGHLLSLSFTGIGVDYIASQDNLTWAEITRTLGAAIGKTDLPFVQLTDDQSLQGMLGAGLNADYAGALIVMNRVAREGLLQEDYWKNKPAQLGKIKLADFAKEFAAAYNAG